MIYIPSRFIIPISQSDSVYETEIVEPPSTQERYGKYSAVEMNVSNITNYSLQGIDVSKGEKNARIILTSIVKQLERLQETVKDLDYDLLIMDDTHFGYIREGECDCYRIIRKNFSSSRKLRVVIELPIFFKNGDRFGMDSVTIYEGIQKAVLNNLNKNTQYFDSMMNNLKSRNTQNTLNELWNQVKIRNDLLVSYKELLKLLDNEHQILKNRISRIQDEGPGTKTHRLRKNDIKKIQECLEYKRQIVQTLQFLRTDIDSLVFPLERSLFENAEMMNSLCSNMDIISSLSLKSLPYH